MKRLQVACTTVSLALSVVVFSVSLYNSRSASAQTPQDSLTWLSQVNDSILDFECRIRFGEDPTQFSFSENLIQEKWKTVDAILAGVEGKAGSSPWKEIDTLLINVFRMQREFELLSQKQEKELAEKWRYLAFRLVLEEMGGEDVGKIYDSMPDDWVVKQDIPGLAQELMNAGITLSEFRNALSQAEFQARDYISNHAGPRASAILTEYDRTHRFESIVLYERDWLARNRPGLLDRMNIEAGARLRELKSYLSPVLTEPVATDLRRYGGPPARQLLVHLSWADYYEQQQLPWLAADQLAAAKRLVWQAYQSTMKEKAAAYNPQTQWAEKLQALMESTRHPAKKDSIDPQEFVVVNPISSDAFPQIVDTVGQRFGFVGGIELAATPVALELSGDGRYAILMCQSGLITVDLETGQRQHLIFDQQQGVTLNCLAVTRDGKYAFVVTSEPSVQRFDLTKGMRDPGFAEITLKRGDDKVAVSDDGNLLAVGGDVNLYDAKSGAHKGKLKGRFNTMKYGMSFSPDGRFLFTHGNDPRIMFSGVDGKTKGGERRIVEKGNVYVYRLVSRWDGIQIACGPGAITAWRGSSPTPAFHVQLPQKIADKFRWADVTPDHNYIISSLGIWNFQTGELVVRFNPTWDHAAMALTPDGKRLLLTQGNKMFVVPFWLTATTGIADGSAGAGNRSAPGSAANAIGDPGPADPARGPSKNAGSDQRVEPLRAWRDASGNYEVRAKLLAVTGDNVKLEKADGIVIEVEISRLSAADQQYIRKRSK